MGAEAAADDGPRGACGTPAAIAATPACPGGSARIRPTRANHEHPRPNACLQVVNAPVRRQRHGRQQPPADDADGVRSYPAALLARRRHPWLPRRYETVWLVTTRPIQAGDEITVHYGPDADAICALTHRTVPHPVEG